MADTAPGTHSDAGITKINGGLESEILGETKRDIVFNATSRFDI